MACLTWTETESKCSNEFGENKINWSIKRKKLMLHYRLHKVFTAAWRTLELSRHWFANAQVTLNIMGIGSSSTTFLPFSPLNPLWSGLLEIHFFWVLCGCSVQAVKDVALQKHLRVPRLHAENLWKARATLPLQPQSGVCSHPDLTRVVFKVFS